MEGRQENCRDFFPIGRRSGQPPGSGLLLQARRLPPLLPVKFKRFLPARVRNQRKNTRSFIRFYPGKNRNCSLTGLVFSCREKPKFMLLPVAWLRSFFQ